MSHSDPFENLSSITRIHHRDTLGRILWPKLTDKHTQTLQDAFSFVTGVKDAPLPSHCILEDHIISGPLEKGVFFKMAPCKLYSLQGVRIDPDKVELTIGYKVQLDIAY